MGHFSRVGMVGVFLAFAVGCSVHGVARPVASATGFSAPTIDPAAPGRRAEAPAGEHELQWALPPLPKGWEQTTDVLGRYLYSLTGTMCMVVLTPVFRDEDPPLYPGLTEIVAELIHGTDHAPITTPTSPLRLPVAGSPAVVVMEGVEVHADGYIGTLHAHVSGRYALVLQASCPEDEQDWLDAEVLSLVGSFGVHVL